MVRADSFYHVLQPSEPGTAGNTGGFHKTASLRPAGKKMGLIVKYGFTKNTLVRTLGQMLFIGTDREPV